MNCWLWRKRHTGDIFILRGVVDVCGGTKGGNPGVSDVALTNLKVAIKHERDANTDDQQGA